MKYFCWFCFIFLHGSFASFHFILKDENLGPLGEVLSGPAKERIIIIHIDLNLPDDIVQNVLNLKEVQHIPHILICVNQNSLWLFNSKEDQFHAVSRSSNTLHVFVFENYKPELLHILWNRWTPRNLLLYNLGSVNATDVFGHEALSHVGQLALIMEMQAEKKALESSKFAVFTHQPFLSTVPVFLKMWDPKLFVNWSDLFIERYPSFEGFLFKVSSWMIEKPFIYQTPSRQSIEGISSKMLNILSTTLNFTYTLIEEPPDKKFGENINGTWDGLLGLVYKGEKHFTVNNLYLTWERTRSFDASVPCWQDGYGIFLLKPKMLPKWMSLYSTFAPFVWIAVGVLLAVAAIFSYLQVKGKMLYHTP